MKPPPQTHWRATQFTLGDLEVYSIVPWGQMPEVVNNFWWRDCRYPNGNGPFSSLQDCMESFKATLVMRPQDPTDNVIHVDFKRRERVR